MFEIVFQPLALNAAAPEANELASGAPAEVQFSVIGGLLLPLAQQGSSQPIAIPAATFSFALSKADAKDIGQKLTTAAESLPDRPSIPIARDLSEVSRAAEFDARLRGT